MNNITHHFEDIYLPQKALVVYQNKGKDEGQVYVEAYDLDGLGRPINAHPLDVQECAAMVRMLDASEELNRDFLRPKGMLTDNILHINPTYDASVTWYTKAGQRHLLFADSLGITSGTAAIPALLWRATREQLWVYALKTDKRPDMATRLYHAPFFNIHEDGLVCMGTVDVETAACDCLEDFITAWEGYFFNSYFSHLIGERSPIRSNIVQLWQDLTTTEQIFPNSLLMPAQQVKHIIR